MSGHPRVGAQQREHAVLRDAAGVEPQRRDAQTLLEAFLRVGRHAPRDEAAEVGVVGDGRDDAHQAVASEDRLHDEDVRQVHPARERVVDHDDVARDEGPAELAQDRCDSVGERAQLVRQSHALGDDLALRVTQRRREVHRALHCLGMRRPDDADRHLLADRGEALADQLASDRICAGAAGHGRFAHRASSMTMFQPPSRQALKSGGTTVVAS